MFNELFFTARSEEIELSTVKTSIDSPQLVKPPDSNSYLSTSKIHHEIDSDDDVNVAEEEHEETITTSTTTTTTTTRTEQTFVLSTADAEVG